MPRLPYLDQSYRAKPDVLVESDPTSSRAEQPGISFVVIATKIVALKEMIGQGEVAQPTLKSVLELEGERMALAPESTPRKQAFIYANAVER